MHTLSTVLRCICCNDAAARCWIATLQTHYIGFGHGPTCSESMRRRVALRPTPSHSKQMTSEPSTLTLAVARALGSHCL